MFDEPLAEERRIKITFQPLTEDMDISALQADFKDLEIVKAWALEEVVREISDSEIFVSNSRLYNKAMVEAVKSHAKRLKWIHFVTSGIDGPVRAGGFPDGVVVTNSAGLRAAHLSEHVFGMLLFLNRRMRAIEAARQTRSWIRDDIWRDIITLSGKTIAIIGMGAIGQAVAAKAKAFNMRVIGVSRAFSAGGAVDAVYPREQINEALAQADVVLLSIPSETETIGFMDAGKLAAMKSSAYLLNVSRGDVVDEPALIEILRSGGIQAAGLDVTMIEPNPPESPLWGMENVLITPHVGGAGAGQNEDAMLEMFAENLRLHLKGEPLLRVVDWREIGI